MPKHLDKGTCRHCGKPIQFWDANPGERGEHWFHIGRTYRLGAKQQPNYCNETEAEPR